MSFNKIRASEKTTKMFPILKKRTGLTPNILCRMAICLSITDPAIPTSKVDDERGQEFSRYTLLGEWDPFFIAILKERLIQDGLDPDNDLMPQFKAHLNRGVAMLFVRIKDLSDIRDLVLPRKKGENYADKRTLTRKSNNSTTNVGSENYGLDRS
jgi:DNA sulfur modification protein DndE